jgi:tRNA threonylcarbamoyladenosine biosynthesis protein TsaB
VILLAWDTATPFTAVALMKDGVLLSQDNQPGKAHSRTLLPSIDRLLKDNQVEKKDLDAIAVGVGPGSFTGIRVGMSLAKTIAFSFDLQLIGTSTLLALAQNGLTQNVKRICPTLDAVKNEVFCTSYRLQAGQLIALQEEAARSPKAWAEELAQSDESCLLIGDGAKRYQDVFAERMGPMAIIPNEAWLHQIKGESVGRLAIERIEKQQTDNPHSLEPNYCRLSEAEIMRSKRI